jgi:hypothetical protein
METPIWSFCLSAIRATLTQGEQGNVVPALLSSLHYPLFAGAKFSAVRVSSLLKNMV